MTKNLVETTLLDYLQRDIGIYNSDNRLIKSGKLIIVNIKDYVVNFTLQKKNTKFTYEMPYPYTITKQPDGLILDYRLEALSHNNDLLKVKFTLNKPIKCNKFYDTFFIVKSI